MFVEGNLIGNTRDIWEETTLYEGEAFSIADGVVADFHPVFERPAVEEIGYGCIYTYV